MSEPKASNQYGQNFRAAMKRIERLPPADRSAMSNRLAPASPPQPETPKKS
jgi:hypothetical protein